MNEIRECSPIPSQSKKLRTVVKSAMVSGTLVQGECAAACYWLASLLNEILYNYNKKQWLPAIECNTESRQSHEAILSVRPILDKWLRIDIALLWQMIEKKEIQKIDWIPPHELQIPSPN